MAEDTLQEAAPQEQSADSGGTPDEKTQSESVGDSASSDSSKEVAETPWWQKVYKDKYSSEEEAIQGTMEATRLVGQKQERAKLIDELAEVSGYSTEEVENQIQKAIQDARQAPPSNRQSAVPQSDLKVAQLEARIEIKDFLEEKPDAKLFKDKLVVLKGRFPNRSVGELYDEFYGDVVKQQQAARKTEEKQAKQIETGRGASAVEPENEEADEAYSKFQKEGGVGNLTDYLQKSKRVK
jgi:hypothetical protein